MYYLIASAKTMKKSEYQGNEVLFKKKSTSLFELIKAMSKQELQQALKISDKLNEEVYALYHHHSFNGLCLDIYDGVVFKHLNYQELDKSSQEFALNHILISSAMYGLLRANDNIKAYRLDMLAKLDINLKQYWHDEVVAYLKQLDDLIVDLSSNEFSQVWNKDFHNYYVIKFVKEGKKDPIKKLRGLFLRECCVNKVEEVDSLKLIEVAGYKYCEELSNQHELVYVKE